MADEPAFDPDGPDPGWMSEGQAMGSQDGAWTAVGLPGVSVAAADRWAALDAMRAAIAARLEVEPGTFDLEIG